MSKNANRPAPVVNIGDLDFHQWDRDSVLSDGTSARYTARVGPIGQRIGASQLGCNLTVVPPLQRAFPYHNHVVNEELFYILSGEGELRLGADRYPVRAGDVISCRCGGVETAHQLINRSATEELRYLAISTMNPVEVSEYPETGEFGVQATSRGDAETATPTFVHFGKR